MRKFKHIHCPVSIFMPCDYGPVFFIQDLFIININDPERFDRAMSFIDFIRGLDFWSVFKSVDLLRDGIDIFLVSVLLYYVFKMFRETRAFQLIKGLVVIVVLFILVNIFDLKTMQYIINTVLTIGLFGAVVVFQPEMRRALEQVGRIKIPGFTSSSDDIKQTHQSIDIICNAVQSMSDEQIGALMVIERQTKLGEIINTGTLVDAKMTSELIGNIFFPKSPLHDGAMIIRSHRIHAAGCFLPISESRSVSRELGTRHRAALGMSENSDALIVVVSEETGHITLAENGNLRRKLDIEQLRLLLRKGLTPEKDENESKNALGKVRSIGKKH